MPFRTTTESAAGSAPVPRRTFLAGAAVAPLAAAPSAPAIAAGRRTWRMVTSWPRNSPGPGTTAADLADRITRMSDGRLTVELHAAGELVPGLEVFDAVSGGTVEMAHTASFFWANKLPASVFFTAVPFGLTPEAHGAWIRFGGGQELWDTLYGPFGIRPLLAGNSGIQMGGWYRRELESLDDLKGLKLRMPGLGGAIMQRLGAVPVVLAPGEIFPALMSGTVDGAEYLGPWADRGLGLHRAARYYYGPGFHEPNGSAECLIGRTAFDSLPGDLQAVVRSACAAVNDAGLAEAEWQNAVALRALQQEGVAIRRFPDDVLTAAHREGGAVLDELGAGSPVAGRILDSYREAQALMLDWARVGHHAVVDAALRHDA